MAGRGLEGRYAVETDGSAGDCLWTTYAPEPIAFWAGLEFDLGRELERCSEGCGVHTSSIGSIAPRVDTNPQVSQSRLC